MIYGREKAKVPVTVLTTPVIPKVIECNGGYEWQYRTIVDFVKEQDKRAEEQIFKKIVDYAIEHNIGTVYLIDEEFVKTALLNEIERRNKE